MYLAFQRGREREDRMRERDDRDRRIVNRDREDRQVLPREHEDRIREKDERDRREKEKERDDRHVRDRRDDDRHVEKKENYDKDRYVCTIKLKNHCQIILLLLSSDQYDINFNLMLLKVSCWKKDIC